MTRLPALALVVLVAVGCDDKKKTSPPDDPAAAAASSTAAAASTAASAGSPPAAPAAPIAPAGSLNKFFPADGASGYKRTFGADKIGYAEAKLEKDGKEVATISITDGVKPFAKAHFDSATDRLEGFPVMVYGDKSSAVLVKDRYQVKVVSPTLDHEGRKAILGLVDLKGM